MLLRPFLLVIIKEGIVNNIKNRSLQEEMKVMTKSNNDFEDITRLCMDFCREFGVTINDEEYFIDKVQTYGYREIIYQYLYLLISTLQKCEVYLL